MHVNAWTKWRISRCLWSKSNAMLRFGSSAGVRGLAGTVTRRRRLGVIAAGPRGLSRQFMELELRVSFGGDLGTTWALERVGSDTELRISTTPRKRPARHNPVSLYTSLRPRSLNGVPTIHGSPRARRRTHRERVIKHFTLATASLALR